MEKTRQLSQKPNSTLSIVVVEISSWFSVFKRSSNKWKVTSRNCTVVYLLSIFPSNLPFSADTSPSPMNCNASPVRRGIPPARLPLLESLSSSRFRVHHHPLNRLEQMVSIDEILTRPRRTFFWLDCLINVKIIGRSLESILKAQQLIKAFEEKNYQKRQIHHNNIHLFNEHGRACLSALRCSLSTARRCCLDRSTAEWMSNEQCLLYHRCVEQ